MNALIVGRAIASVTCLWLIGIEAKKYPNFKWFRGTLKYLSRDSVKT